MSEEIFELPDEVTKSTGTSPRDLVLISQPKMGKSAIFGDFSVKYNGLVFNLEKGGYEYIDARKIDIHKDETTSDVEAFYNYIGYRDNLLAEKGKYDMLIIDGLSDLDKMSEIGGTLMYMDSTIGKNFNKKDKTDVRKNAPRWNPGDAKFKSVLTLADGAGYWWTRKWFLAQIELFREISPYRMYAAHIVEKYIKDNSKEEVTSMEIALTGQLKRIFATKVTALGKLIAKDSQRFINFEVLNDSIIAGSRAPFLKNKILLSEKQTDDSIVTYWDNIFDNDLLNEIK